VRRLSGTLPTAPSSGRSRSRPGAPYSPTTRRRQLGRRLAFGDTLVIAAASGLAYFSREMLGRVTAIREFANEVPAALAVIPLWLLLFYGAGAYRPEYLNAGGDALRRFVAGVVGGVLALGFASFALNLQLSRLFVALLAAGVFVGGGVLRLSFRRSLQRRQVSGDLLQHSLVVGTDEDAVQLVDALTTHRDSSYRVLGYLDEQAPVGMVIEGIPILGRPGDVLTACEEYGAGVVIVSPAGVSPGTLRDLTIALEGSPIDLAVAPSLVQVVTRRMTIETVGGVPILHVDQIRLERGKAILKRTLDIGASALLLFLSAPLCMIVAISVRLGSAGPVLFRQERVGKDGQPFTMLKFRTMVADAEQRLDEVRHLNETEGHFFKATEDPRITPVGRFLRSWSIDELPQLVNVLRGEMSMVGPRPPLPHEVAEYDDWQLRRLRVRPGITGIWQVSGRSNVPFDEAVRLDLFYIENWSLGYDLYLMGRTIGAVLTRRGAW
jgi:exopolysaccharide biosynthesis polyprenyl glycosylphosphotransferase